MSEFPPPDVLTPPDPNQPYGPPMWSSPLGAPPVTTEPATGPPNGPITDKERRWWTGVPTAVWIGLVGSTLILVASIFVVVARWDSIGRGLRTAGVTALMLGMIAAAYRLRRATPTMASIIVHLGGALTTMVGIAAVSMFGYTWPSCIAVGGALGFGASVWLSSRWKPSRFAYLEVANLCAAAIGVAALTGTTAGLWAVAAAAGCSFVGWRRRSVALGVLAISTPISALAAAVGVGPGTLARAGMIGDRLMWSGPIVGVLAGVIVIRAGRQLGQRGIVLAGASMPLIGFVTGLAVSDAPAAVWWSLPGLILIALNLALELSTAHPGTDRYRDGVDGVAAVVGGVGAILAIAASPSTNTVTIFGVEVGAGRWVVPAVATLVALVTTTYRWRRSPDSSPTVGTWLVDAGLAASVAVAYGVLIVVNIPAVAVAMMMLAVVAVAVVASVDRSPVLIAPSFLIILWTCARAYFVDHTAGRMVGMIVIAVALVGAIVFRLRRGAGSTVGGKIENAAYVWIGSIAIALISGWAVLPTIIGSIAIASSVSTVLDRRLLANQLIGLATIGVIAVETYAVLGVQSWPWAIGFGVAALATAAVAARSGDRPAGWVTPSMVSGVYAALTTVAMLRALWLPASAVLTMSCALAVAFAGMWAVSRVAALGTYSATVSVFALLLISSFGVSSWWASVLVMVIGAQVTIAGARLEIRPLAAVGLAAFVAGATSLIVTTPLNEWVDRWLDAIDATTADLALAALTVATLVAGWWARRRFGINSWLAYSVGLSIGGIWLVTSAGSRVTVWAVPLGLVLGVGATALGAWGRLGSPLVGGTAITIGTMVAGYHNYIGSIPVWVWLGIGGFVLIGVAVAVERGSKQGATLGDLVSRWQ